MRRRTVLLAIGGTLATAAGGLGAFAATRTPTAALAPWRALDAAADADPRIFALRRGILAPNPHNLQPWRITLIGDDAAEIAWDGTRRLPATDPFDRQLTIGFGCLIELARIAATTRGVAIAVEPFPEGADPGRLDARPAARLAFRRAAELAPDPLAAAIAQRRSTKTPFRDAPVSAAALAGLRTAAGAEPGVDLALTADPARIAALKALTWTAWETEARTAPAFRESVDLMRIGRREIEMSPDGIALGGPMLEALAAVGALSRAQIADPATDAYAQGVAKYRAMLATAGAYAWIATDDGSRAAQLAAGRAYMRLDLAAAAAGIAIHPISQALQEYPEMAQPFAEARRLTATGGAATLQMLARLGYADRPGPAPRWPLEAKLA